MSRGKLFVMSGPSGTGKGSICRILLQECRNLVCSVSMTTRSPRKGEKEGIDYYFVTKEEFEKKIAAEGFLEYAKVFENYYGTPEDTVLNNLNAGNDVLLEIDVQGAMQIKKSYSDAILVFVLPPSMSELESRIRGRGTETEDMLRIRLAEAAGEIRSLNCYDYAIINDNLEEAVEKVRMIIASEHSKVEDYSDMVERILNS